MENQSLPESDPFSFTMDSDTPSVRKTVILTGNWLAESIFYLVHSTWDIKGIVILRALLFVCVLFFTFLTIKKQEVSDLTALLFTFGVFYTAPSYSGERPQLFTFLAFSIVYYLLEDHRRENSKKVFFIPPLVMVLANTHPGYIICILLVTIYLVGEGTGLFFKKGMEKSSFHRLSIAWGLTIILSLVNPNGWTVLASIFAIHGDYTKGIVEFMPTVSLYLRKVTPVNYAYLAFLFLSLLCLRYLRQIGITRLLLLAVFTAMSFIAIRYLLFYMCLSAPILARIMRNLKDEQVLKKFPLRLQPWGGVIHIAACIIGVIFLFHEIPAFARSDFRAETFHHVPKGAADFLDEVDIRGNMFNEYGFGGYLIWRLYPGRKVFIDGRMLDESIYLDYQVVAYAVESTVVSWEDIIERNHISHIVMPPLLHHGNIYPIVETLFEREEWVLIYMDHLSLIFVRNDPWNASLIKKYTIDKQEGLHTIVIQASARALKNPVNPYFLITLGKIFFKTGRFDDAEKAFLMARERDPENPEIQEWLEKLKDKRTHGMKGSFRKKQRMVRLW
ncbi:tetratricopeptide repeat protein [bacterium]|nr:MAG: tetratricopeptide repeat protein [bacterium]